MSKVTYQRFMLLLLCVLFACTKSEHPDNYKIKNFEFEDFPDVEKLEGTKLNIKELLAPRRILNLKDYLVVSDNRAEYLLYVIDKKNNKVVNSLGVLGRGPGEIQHAWGLSSTNLDSLFWVYQSSRQKISLFNIYQKRPFSIEEIDLLNKSNPNVFAQTINLTFTSDSTFIASMIDGKNKYVEFNKNMVEVAAYDNWQHMEDDKFPIPVISNVYQGWLGYNDRNKYVVMATLKLDQIEVLNKNTGEVLSLRGPIHYKPEFFVAYSAGAPMAAYKEDSKYMYMSIFCGEKFFYALLAKEGRYGGYDILAFDYEGKPKIHYQLDKKIKRFTVDEQAHKLYGITVGDPEPNILVFEY